MKEEMYTEQQIYFLFELIDIRLIYSYEFCISQRSS